MRIVRIIAFREFRDVLHSRWLFGFALLFAFLTIAISTYGVSAAQSIEYRGFSQVSASLLNLILFTVPMVSMILPALSLTTDEETLFILLTQPLNRSQVLIGKYLGMAGALGSTLLGGLLLGGMVVLIQAGGSYLGSFMLLVLLTAMLIGLFLALGIGIAVFLRERARAMGTCLGVWFFTVILYDLLVFGLTVAGPAIPLKTLLLTAIVLNPVDAIRVLYLLAVGNNSFVGATGAVIAQALGGTTGIAVLAAVTLGWTLAALGASVMLFKRTDL